MRTTLELRDLRRRGDRLTARFTGTLRGEYYASVVDNNQWGDGLTERTATADVTVTVALALSWPLAGRPGPPRRVRVRITDGQIDTDLE